MNHAKDVCRDANSLAKGPGPFAVLCQDEAIQKLPGRNSKSDAKGATIVNVSRHIDAGLNGSSSESRSQ